jgi:uncharacterized YccA/Bax inhibitor family protein
MITILQDLAITLVLIFLNHWVYGVEDSITYQYIVDLIARKQTFFLGLGILGSGSLLISATMFESLGLYKITYGLSRILVRVSQFLIIFLAVLNIAFYVALSNNLIRDNGYLALILLLLILGSSCWSLRIIDFNYPVRNAMVPVTVLALLSVILVEIIWPLTNF